MTRMLSTPPASMLHEPDQRGAPEQRKRRRQQARSMTREKQLALVEEARAARLEQPARREGN
jgi:hypothetical protein